MFEKIFKVVFATVAAIVCYFLLSAVTTQIFAHAFTSATLLRIIDMIFVGPFSIFMASMTSKRMCGHAYPYYVIMILIQGTSLVYAVTKMEDKSYIPSLVVMVALSVALYYYDLAMDNKRKKEELEKREARIAAGLPPTEEEEAELRKAQEEAEAEAYAREHVPGGLYDEDEPDMWDDPDGEFSDEDEEALLHEEYHGAYEEDEKAAAEAIARGEELYAFTPEQAAGDFTEAEKEAPAQEDTGKKKYGRRSSV